MTKYNLPFKQKQESNYFNIYIDEYTRIYEKSKNNFILQLWEKPFEVGKTRNRIVPTYYGYGEMKQDKQVEYKYIGILEKKITLDNIKGYVVE